MGIVELNLSSSEGQWEKISFRVQGSQDIDRAEWMAILGGYKLYISYDNVIFVADRLSMVKHLQAEVFSGLHRDIKRIIKHIHYTRKKMGKKNVYCWTKAHVDILGNDLADGEAKKGCVLMEKPVVVPSEPGMIMTYTGSECSTKIGTWRIPSKLNWEKRWQVEVNEEVMYRVFKKLTGINRVMVQKTVLGITKWVGMRSPKPKIRVEGVEILLQEYCLDCDSEHVRDLSTCINECELFYQYRQQVQHNWYMQAMLKNKITKD